MKTTLFALLVGCAPAAMTTTPDHPANPDAPVGRLAGPPPALRPGVVDISKPAASTTDHAGHGAAPSTPTDHTGHGAQPSTQAPPASPDAEPAPTAEPAKPAAKKPAQKPSKPAKPPASKKAPEPSTDKPQQPPAHHGHEGHHE